MSKAADLAALIGSQTALLNRNLIINGAMAVSQRSTSVTGITGGGYNTIDRMKVDLNDNGTWTHSQDTDVPSGNGFANSWKLNVTTADTSVASGSYHLFRYLFEGQDLQQLKKGTSSAESVTVSFWIKSTITGTYIAELFDADNSRQISQSYTISTANTWEKKTLTFAGDTSGTLDNDNGSSFSLNLWFGAGSDFSSGTLNTSWASSTNANRAVGQVNCASSISNNIYITGIQLEVGEQATPFEHRSYGVELRRCMRYYEKSYLDTQYFMNGSSGAQVQRQTNYYQVQKRAAATLTQTATHADGSATVGNVGGNIDGITHSFGGADNNRVAFSWTADAEL